LADWESKTVNEALNEIGENIFSLPVIQRRLIWGEEKMELLFDTLLKNNSFGGIMVLEEEKGSRPLFAFRPFTKDGNPIDSISIDARGLSNSQYFVIDG
jgi:hypothetical protein